MTTANQSLSKHNVHNATDTIRSALRGWRGLLVLGVIVLGFGLIFKWNWLVAAGIAPILLAVLPCAAMCALGLCMRKMSGSASTPQSSDEPGDAAEKLTAPLPLAGSDDSSNAPISGDKPANLVTVTQKSCCHNPR